MHELKKGRGLMKVKVSSLRKEEAAMEIGTVPISLLLEKHSGQSQENADPGRGDESINGGELGLHLLIQMIQAILYRLKTRFQTLKQRMMLLNAAFKIGHSFRQGVDRHRISLAGGLMKVKEIKETAVWALKIAAFAGFWALFSAAPSWATRGLSTKFAEVEVKNLKIGLSYSLQKTVNLPLRVSNTGSEPMELKVTVVAPKAGEGKPGYEPIPDTSWITLARSTFTVFPNMDAATDVFIHIPNDPKLLGRRFIAYLWTESQNKGFLGVGLKSRLLLSISSEKPTAAELKKKFIETGTANLNFSFAPMEVMAGNVPTGKTVKLSKFKADLKLANPNEAAYHFRLTPVGLWETSISVPSGFVPAPDPKWLIAPKPVFVAEPYSFNSLGLKVRIPNKPENRGKSFMLILRAEILEQNAPDYAYAKIFITTKK